MWKKREEKAVSKPSNEVISTDDNTDDSTDDSTDDTSTDDTIKTKGIQSIVKELLARAKKTKCVYAKDIPGFAECENDLLQVSDSTSRVHFSHSFQATLTDIHHELQLNF